MLNVERNKLSHISRISEKVEVYHANELKKVWTSDLLRNWDLYVKYPKFEDWSSWNSGGSE